MTHPFQAQIYQTGINWCVDVPVEITVQLQSKKGYIKIKGEINGFAFTQTLVPVKNAPYRLFVNGIMMKGGKTALGEVADFSIEQDLEAETREYPVPAALSEALSQHNLTDVLHSLKPHHKKEILKYFSFIKTETTLQKNIDKLIRQLMDNPGNVRIP